jgi:hypothetical protein
MEHEIAYRIGHAIGTGFFVGIVVAIGAGIVKLVKSFTKEK